MKCVVSLTLFLDIRNGHFMPLVELQDALDELVKHLLGGSGVNYRRREGECLVKMQARLSRHDTQAGINEAIHRLAGNDSRRVSFFAFAWNEHS